MSLTQYQKARFTPKALNFAYCRDTGQAIFPSAADAGAF